MSQKISPARRAQPPSAGRGGKRSKVALAMAGGGPMQPPVAAAAQTNHERPAVKVTRRTSKRSKVALAMAGGGPLGAIYEIGALTALSEVLQGANLNDLDMYVGVSAGGILGAGLANGITPRDMVAMFIEPDATRPALERFDPAVLMRPALHEYGKRLRKVPALLAQAGWHYLTDRRGRGWLDSFGRLTQAIPAGVFSNQGLLDFLTATFTQPGRSNDFRKLKAQLFLVATDLDSGAAVAFGAPGHEHVPIARAAVASAALPGLFPPVEIDGRCYLDGALKRTLHASVALKAGADLVLCLNPIVPYDDRVAHQPRPLIDGGLPVVLSQTLRALVHSRMEIGMRQYDDDYRGADVLLFEPQAADADMFFANAFSYANRRRLCEHAYQRTRSELRERAGELAPVLARHGITLDRDHLAERTHRLVQRRVPGSQDQTLGGARRDRKAAPSFASVTAELGERIADLQARLQVVRGRRGGCDAMLS